MYSRYHNRPPSSVTLPENYSGCAFSRPSVEPVDSSSATVPRKIDVAKPTPLHTATVDTVLPSPSTPPSMPAPPRAVLLPPVKEAEAEPKELPQENQASHDGETPHSTPVSVPLPFKKLFGNMGNAFPFTHGIGFDELLIIGLIILLSHSGGDSDLILWLALLLFCG